MEQEAFMGDGQMRLEIYGILQLVLGRELTTEEHDAVKDKLRTWQTSFKVHSNGELGRVKGLCGNCKLCAPRLNPKKPVKKT